MTNYEHIMLSLCFGATAGWLIVGLWFSGKCAFDWIKEKLQKRKYKE